MRAQFQCLFGDNYSVEGEGTTYYVTAGSVGTLTFNVKDRWWNLGRTGLPLPGGVLFEQPTHGFKGLGWRQKMVTAMKVAFKGLGLIETTDA